MITDHEAQTLAREHWVVIRDWRDESIRRMQRKLAALEAKILDGTATKEDIIAENEKEDIARKVEELTKEKEASDARSAELQAEIDALTGDK